MVALSLIVLAAYLIGAIPFGYLIAKAKGVDLFQVGSGNIGATNVGRALGRKIGVLVFVLDFLKGAVPVGVAPRIFQVLTDGAGPGIPIDLVRVLVALAVVVGHMFPVYLRFHGGKGVATGAGTLFVLTPGPAVFALGVWLATVFTSRMISLGSIVAAIALVTARGLATSFAPDTLIVTTFCGVAAAIVILKHRANIARIRAGRENLIGDRPMNRFLQRAIHLLALALWLGGSVFFNLLAAPTIFRTFDEVAKSGPSDRTAYHSINSTLEKDQEKEDLGKALAGAAVGPLFPIYFGLSATCGVLALITALGWRGRGKLHRWRVRVVAAALLLTGLNWWISTRVTELRLARFSKDTAIAEAARADFGTWHLYSLALSMLTLVLVLAATILAARLPGDVSPPDRQAA